MVLQLFEGTSHVDAGLSRRGMSLIGNVIHKTGLALGTDATTNEIVLFTSNLPSKLLNQNGKALYVEVIGSVSNAGVNKRSRLRVPNLAGTIVCDTGNFGNPPLGLNGYIMFAWITRTGASSQDLLGHDVTNTGGGGITFNQTTLNSSSGIQFVVTGIGTGTANDLVVRSVRVALLTEGGVQTAGGVLV